MSTGKEYLDDEPIDEETREAAWLWWILQPKGTPRPECIADEVERAI